MTIVILLIWSELAFASISSLTNDELEYIAANPVIRVANEMDWPPYDYNEAGAPKGYSIDFIRMVADKVGLQIEFVSGPSWTDFIKMAQEGQIDVLLNIVKTPERMTFLEFTSSYLTSVPSFFVRDDNTHIIEFDNLSGKTVAVPKGYLSYDVLQEYYPDIAIFPTRNLQGALEAVISGQADAAISSPGVANFVIKQNGLAGLKLVAKIEDANFSNLLNLAVPKGQTILRNILQKSMLRISDEEVFELRTKWFYALSELLVLNTIERAYLEERADITACIDPDWLPFEKFDRSGKHIGMTAEYLNIIAEYIGKRISVIKTLSWAESLDKAKSKECDILSLAMETPERKKYLNFSKPYITSPLVIATGLNKPFIPDVASIGSNRVGLVKGYAFAEMFKLFYPEINVVEVDNLSQGLKLVSRGELFGMLDSLATVGFAIQEDFLGKLKISGKFEESLNMGVAVRKDEPLLLKIMDKAIQKIAPEQHREISNHWVAVHYKVVTDHKLLYQIIALFCAVGLVFTYYQIQLRKLNKKLKSLSVTDKLTQLANRGRLDEMLQLRFDEYLRYGHPFSIMLIDIDNFKAINDDYGHQAGDNILKRVSDILKHHSRAVDEVGRWGGEEFLIISSRTNIEGAQIHCEKIREELQAVDFGLDRTVTISAGVAEIKPNEDIGGLMCRADTGLYKAKKAGRNKVIVSECVQRAP